MKKIFISYSKPKTEDQKNFFEKLITFLESENIKPIFLKDIHYSYDTPITPIIEAIDDSIATLVVCFEKTHIYFCREKERSTKQHDLTDIYKTSVWVQIESAISVAKNKPVLILKPDYIYNEGFLDSNYSDIYEFFSLKTQKLDNIHTLYDYSYYTELEKHLKKWLKTL